MFIVFNKFPVFGDKESLHWIFVFSFIRTVGIKAKELKSPIIVKTPTGSVVMSSQPAAIGPITYPKLRAIENQPSLSACWYLDSSETKAKETGP